LGPEHIQAPWPRLLPAAVLSLVGLLWAALAFGVANPVVLIDEYAYLAEGRAFDRLPHLFALEPALAPYDSPLFFRLISTLGALGLPDRPALKLFDLAFALGAVALLFRVAAGRGERAPLALLLVLGLYPIGSYAGYFMPESLYIFLFALLAWMTTESAPAPSAGRVLAAAALIAALTLVKQHGLFILLALAAALAVWALCGPPGRRLKGLLLAALLVGAWALLFWAGGRFLAPAGAVRTVGPLYQDLIGRSIRAAAERPILGVLANYLGAVLMLAAPSLIFVSWRVLDQLRGRAARTGPGFAGLFLLTALGVIGFSVVFIMSGEFQRIHLRYLNFALLALVALAWRLGPREEPAGFRRAAALAWAAGTLLFLWRSPSFRPMPVDAPELFFAYTGETLGRFGLGAAAPAFTALVFLGGAAALLTRRARWFELQLGALVLTSVVSIWNLAHWQARESAQFAPYRAVGKAARALCGAGEGDIRAVSANDPYPAVLYQALSVLDREIPVQLVAPADTAAAAAAVPPRVCLLATDDPSAAGFEQLYAAPGLGLYRRPAP
jgi:phosphoglycerol transferase